MFLNREHDLEDTILYHYTTPEGLLGILQDDNVKLYFTKFSALNDKMEGRIFNQRFFSICQMLYDEGKIEEEEMKDLLHYVDFEMGTFYFHIDGKTEEFHFEDTYICSFSLEKDSLPMWNYYVKNGGYQGYNIGFKNPFIHCKVADSSTIDRVLQICEVLYSEELLHTILEESADIVKNSNEHFRNLLHDLSYGALEHKAECFSHEKEVRLIYLASPKDKEKIQYRVKNGVLVPYIEIPFSKETIQEVTVGPLIERELAIKNVKGFLEQRGYQNVQVATSSIPIRY